MYAKTKLLLARADERCKCERGTGVQGEIAFSYISLAKQDGGRVGSRSELHVQECRDFETAMGGNTFYDRLALLELFLL